MTEADWLVCSDPIPMLELVRPMASERKVWLLAVTFLGHLQHLTPHALCGTVRRIAEGIYAERAFDRLPILADALLDAGCDDEAILSHCRTDGPHVRGCWVIDLILGKQ